MLRTTGAVEVGIVAKEGESRARRIGAGARIGVILAVASFVNYMAWLGWDHEWDVEPDGSLSGPYQPWQVAGLVVGLGFLAGLAGRRGHPRIGTLSIAGVMWLSWSVNAAISDDSGLWAVGAAMLLPAVFLGVGLVAFLTSLSKSSRHGVRRAE
ncbi:hypothetical protein GCM10023193_51260 [Planotetraspora kaengkrachanensis]|uniref:Uncharacterized protein n=2 Tax=Planotetraspora kaengkrachanensis TaxID=575193 RepID=A0A8J3LW80_9ACTN|nr:hypothetical protein Pka01_26790 [Planotetraspora kaengkrachanensis]